MRRAERHHLAHSSGRSRWQKAFFHNEFKTFWHARIAAGR